MDVWSFLHKIVVYRRFFIFQYCLKMAAKGHVTIFLILLVQMNLYILATFCESFTAIGWLVLEILCVEPIYPQYSGVLETCLALRYWFFEVLGSESENGNCDQYHLLGLGDDISGKKITCVPISLWCRTLRNDIHCWLSNPCTGPRSAVGNVSGKRCEPDCRGREFDPGPVPYFRRDWSWNNFYGHSPSFDQEGLLSVTGKKYVHEVLVNCFKLAQEKGVISWTDYLAMTIAVDLGRKAKHKKKIKPMHLCNWCYK